MATMATPSPRHENPAAEATAARGPLRKALPIRMARPRSLIAVRAFWTVAPARTPRTFTAVSPAIRATATILAAAGESG